MTRQCCREWASVVAAVADNVNAVDIVDAVAVTDHASVVALARKETWCP